MRTASNSAPEPCFYDEADHKTYLSFLKESAFKYRVAIHAFVLMANHTHLSVIPRDEQGLSRMMQTLGRKDVQSLNSYTANKTVALIN